MRYLRQCATLLQPANLDRRVPASSNPTSHSLDVPREDDCVFYGGGVGNSIEEYGVLMVLVCDLDVRGGPSLKMVANNDSDIAAYWLTTPERTLTCAI
ncbi:hypothetical protein JTE90_015339 [Oedothorax gibbosus]|uniref:Uncharacterized protein n=1 Tax=Oedothorax gibbosus TaxID=931172 RepID=A0AAV6U693_9ARAC|nr:hypothetical protein JTE90_015339 [Oedothorax gibbosus]